MRLTKNNPFCHGCSSGMIRKKKKKQRRRAYRVAIRHDTTARSLRCCVCRTWCNSGRRSSSAELMRSRTGVATPCHYRWMLQLELRCWQKCELKQLNLRVSLKKKKKKKISLMATCHKNEQLWCLSAENERSTSLAFTDGRIWSCLANLATHHLWHLMGCGDRI